MKLPCVHRLALSLAIPVALAGCAGGMRHATMRPDIARLTASDVVAGICNGSFTSAEVTRAYLDRAKARADHNAFVALDEAGAMQAARDADVRRRAGGACLQLQGLPIVVKDNIQVAGLAATAGTPALKNFVPTADAPVVKKLRDAGAVILGKTNMHELAFGISGYNPAYNTSANVGVRNAYDVMKMAGGSSSGSGVAIGARMAPAGLGTDTGGSVRIPCALNGCASLRPTIGRYPQGGIAPISHTRDTAGPMGISMADVDLLDRVITGEPAAAPVDLHRVRLGVVNDFLANLDADTSAAFDAALGKLKAAGVTVVSVAMPQLAALNANVSFPIALYEAYDDMVAYLRSYNTGVTIQQLAAQIASPDVKGTYEGLVIPRVLPTPSGGVTPAAPVYQAAMATHRPALIELYADTFATTGSMALFFRRRQEPRCPPTRTPAASRTSCSSSRTPTPGAMRACPGSSCRWALARPASFRSAWNWMDRPAATGG
jgi:mandelamide amidase